jgi:hypothetical protein
MNRDKPMPRRGEPPSVLVLIDANDPRLFFLLALHKELITRL